MKAKTLTKTRPPRSTDWYIDEIVGAYGRRVHTVALWRRLDRARNVWTYLARLAPEQAKIELVGQRFGGGEYRAKLLGPWDPASRSEQCAICGGMMWTFKTVPSAGVPRPTRRGTSRSSR